jgi:lysophospholipase L1-like esterase
MGDDKMWEWSQTNSGTIFTDGIHLNDAGKAKLGELRANAIRSNLEYQINPDHNRVDGNTYQKTTS